MLAGQAVCKDCGNGTLNNLLNERFIIDGGVVVCNQCYGTHIDGELHDDFEDVEEAFEDENGDQYSDDDYEEENEV